MDKTNKADEILRHIKQIDLKTDEIEDYVAKLRLVGEERSNFLLVVDDYLESCGIDNVRVYYNINKSELRVGGIEGGLDLLGLDLNKDKKVGESGWVSTFITKQDREVSLDDVKAIIANKDIYLKTDLRFPDWFMEQKIEVDFKTSTAGLIVLYYNLTHMLDLCLDKLTLNIIIDEYDVSRDTKHVSRVLNKLIKTKIKNIEVRWLLYDRAIRPIIHVESLNNVLDGVDKRVLDRIKFTVGTPKDGERYLGGADRYKIKVIMI